MANYHLDNKDPDKANTLHYNDGYIIHIANPTDQDIASLAKKTAISTQNINKALANKERARIDLRDNFIFAVVNSPIKTGDNAFSISPICIFLTKKNMTIISYDKVNALKYIENIDCKNMSGINLLLALMYGIASEFNIITKLIINKFEKLEIELLTSTKNEDVISIMDLQRSLVFFSMSLHSNDLAVMRIIKIKDNACYKTSYFAEIDEELLDDVYTENKQSIEVVVTYSKIITDMMNTVASMVANNQNKFLKFLATITILLTIPMIFSSFWGMNVKVPFEGEVIGFIIVLSVSLLTTLLAIIYLWLKKILI
jgi:magnesium transporter